jgi:hypothetical protein
VGYTVIVGAGGSGGTGKVVGGNGAAGMVRVTFTAGGGAATSNLPRRIGRAAQSLWRFALAVTATIVRI